MVIVVVVIARWSADQTREAAKSGARPRRQNDLIARQNLPVSGRDGAAPARSECVPGGKCRYAPLTKRRSIWISSKTLDELERRLHRRAGSFGGSSLEWSRQNHLAHQQSVLSRGELRARKERDRRQARSWRLSWPFWRASQPQRSGRRVPLGPEPAARTAPLGRHAPVPIARVPRRTPAAISLRRDADHPASGKDLPPADRSGLRVPQRPCCARRGLPPPS